MTLRRIIENIDLWAQVVFSVCVILFGITYAVRCIIDKSGDVYVFLFACMAFVGYRLMYRASIDELREARAARRKGGDA